MPVRIGDYCRVVEKCEDMGIAYEETDYTDMPKIKSAYQILTENFVTFEFDTNGKCTDVWRLEL